MTKYDKSVKEDTFKLFSLGKPIERIAKEIGISKTTIYKWKKEEDWDSRANKIKANAIKKVDESLTEIKERQHRLIKGSILRYAEQLKSKEVNIKASDIVNILKHELHLLGETESNIEISQNITAKQISDLYEEIYGNSGKSNKKEED